jgi:membrane-associated phospholipid phosphatase
MQLRNVLVNLSSKDAILRILVFLCVTLIATMAFAQNDSSLTPLLRPPSDSEFVNSWAKSLQAIDSDNGPDHGQSGLGETPTTNADVPQRGLISRSVRRGLQDQKQLYLAPFRRSNLKWDALFLAGTATFLATDRQISRALPTNHLDLARNISNVCLDTTSAALIGLWAYGIKTNNRHAQETGELELETLANTFLIYTPMQFAAGRERPEEGTGNGRFWIHGGFNTSFPAGHPMFTWTMASVLAHEYPRTWVKLLAYGAASSVSAGRFFGRNHFASDIFVGSILGYLIGAHIFHARCQPGVSEACRR